MPIAVRAYASKAKVQSQLDHANAVRTYNSPGIYVGGGGRAYIRVGVVPVSVIEGIECGHAQFEGPVHTDGNTFADTQVQDLSSGIEQVRIGSGGVTQSEVGGLIECRGVVPQRRSWIGNAGIDAGNDVDVESGEHAAGVVVLGMERDGRSIVPIHRAAEGPAVGNGPAPIGKTEQR